MKFGWVIKRSMVVALVMTTAACDSGELTRGKAKSLLNQELAGENTLYLIVCLTGDLSMAASNAERRLCADVGSVFGDLPTDIQERIPRQHSAARMITPHFEKMFFKQHNDLWNGEFPFVTYYPSRDTLSDGPGVLEVIDISDRFAVLHLKNFDYSVAEVEGIRDGDPLERDCDAEADYRYTRKNLAPWAEEWIDQYRLDRTYSRCLVKYDDGWRVSVD